MQVRDSFHRSRPEMFLMTDGARAIFDHVRFVQRVLFMALFAFAIDGGEIDSAMEPVAHHTLKFCERDAIAQRGALVVALRAILRKSRVTARNFP